MASSLMFVFMVITAVILSEAGSLTNRHIKETDGETSNKQKRDFFSWITGKENIPDKLPNHEAGSSDDNRQDQENSIQGKMQKENNTQGTPENDNTQGTPQNDNMQGTPENDNMQGTPENDNMQGTPQTDNMQGTPPGHNITHETPPGHEVAQETPGDQKQSSGEEGSSGENGSQQQPNRRNGDDEWEDIPYTEDPPLVSVGPVLHDDAYFKKQAMR